MSYSTLKKKKICVIKIGAIGDSIFSTIMAYAIKQAHPDWQVDYLTHADYIPLLKDCTYIDNFITWDCSSKFKSIQTLKTLKKMLHTHYDIVFNMTLTLKTLILAFLLFPGKSIRIKKETDRSIVENYYFTAKEGIKDIKQPERLYIDTDKDSINKIHADIDKYPKPYIVIIPGGSSNWSRQGRIWNINKWKELTKHLICEFGGTIFVIGGASEAEYHSTLTGNDIVLLTGKYSLPETSALLSLADLVISGDTGPLHLASMHNVKTLAILGSTSPEKIKPYGENGYYIEPEAQCRYCWKKKCRYLKAGEKYTPCMESIAPDDVIRKIKSEGLIIK